MATLPRQDAPRSVPSSRSALSTPPAPSVSNLLSPNCALPQFEGRCIGAHCCSWIVSTATNNHTPNALAARLGLQYLIAERLLAPLTDRFVAISDSERDEIVNYGLASGNKVDVIYPCFDLDFYDPQDQTAARAALGLPNGVPLIIGVGRLTDQKDPLMFVEIVRRVAAETNSLKAIWLGDGPLREVVEMEVRRTGLEGVIELPGWQADMRPWFAAADLLFSTSKYESFGYMVAEALAMERPVVATSITGTSDIMNGGLERFLYPAGNASAAAERLLLLLLNPAQAKEIGRLDARGSK